MITKPFQLRALKGFSCYGDFKVESPAIPNRWPGTLLESALFSLDYHIRRIMWHYSLSAGYIKRKGDYKMKQLLKKLMAFLLAAVLIFSLCPTMALAEDSVGATEPTDIAEASEMIEDEEAAGIPAAVQAFLDTAAAIQIPEEINEETGPVLNEQIGAAQAAYDALGEEELAREDVQAATLLVRQAMDALAGDVQTLEEPVEAVAQIGNTPYATLDAAIAAAADGDTIELLGNAATDGLDLRKSLTIQAAEGVERPAVTFSKEGIALWGCALTFRNVDVSMNGIGATPYVEWKWMAICASKNASLTLDNATMTMDGNGAGNAHAIYFCSNNKLNLINASHLTIQNYPQDALEWDGGDGGYNINITNSTFLSVNNRSGFTGTFYATIINSQVDVINSRGNGSNGAHFIITDSVVNFNDNADHGLSASKLYISNSTVTACRNGRNGIVARDITIDKDSHVLVEGNTSNSGNVGAFRVLGSTGSCVIDAGADVKIINNFMSGIQVDHPNGRMIMNAGVVTGNGRSTENGFGGGVRTKGSIVMSDAVVLYNNHASDKGDDIYVYEGGNVTFEKVGSGWILDDCNDAIDGWYFDGHETDENGIITSTARWDAHSGNPYTVEYTDCGKTISGEMALKAAHKLNAAVPELPEPSEPEWTVSRSKTATNLDGKFESVVTLSLPSAEEQLVTDVVFVLDKSTSQEQENEALQMLQKLKAQIEDTNAAVKVGVVIFNKEAHVTDFMDLATQYDAIESAIRQNISSGTNTHAGLLAGKAMLDADTTVSADRKHLIFVSDGITYMYNQAPTATAWSFRADQVLNWAGPDNWMSKYGSNAAPENWISYLTEVSKQAAAQGTIYEYPYGGTPEKSTPVEKSADYANSVDKALYLTYMTYREAEKAGYHCYAVMANPSKGGQYLWGPSFMDFLAGGETADFAAIQNDIIYLVDAGSYVKDYIGYVADDYDFDFVNEASAMTLKVGDQSYEAVKLGENQYGFKPVDNGYAYTVTYARGDGKGEEHFVWAINEAVTNFAPVQLTYTVKLTNPKTEAGTYGVYDADGSNADAKALYTNNSASLYPVDSNGAKGEPQEFPKPTVSYTVDEPEPPVTDPTPTDPEPTEPDTEPSQPSKPTEPTKPAEPDAPKTGDETNAVMMLAVMGVSLLGIALLAFLLLKKDYAGKYLR